MSTTPVAEKLKSVHSTLLECYGRQDWWPADTPFEVMVGAILTQSAAWGNVEKAIANLKSAGALSPAAIRTMPVVELAALVFPSGYYNAKAKKLKALVEWLGRYGDDLARFGSVPTDRLRTELLSVHGIGPETADSILLYALGRPVFVIDAYTRRLFGRLGFRPISDRYDDWQALFQNYLLPEPAVFNEYHALIVRHAKGSCRKTHRCPDCCLASVCPRV